MHKLVATLLDSERGFVYFMEMEREARRRFLCVILLWVFVIGGVIDFVVVYVPEYDNDGYWNVIQATEGCENVKLVRSFQYRCLQDMAILQAAVGMLLGLVLVEDRSIFVRKLEYSRCSVKFVLRLVVMIVVAVIPLIAVLVPLVVKIDASVTWTAVILWVCQSVGFFLAILFLVWLSPKAVGRCGY